MPTPTLDEFWQLAAASGLLGQQEIPPLKSEFQQIRGAAAIGNARTLCEWLIDRRALSRYQCDVLLLGQAGPFCYGDYLVWDRVRSGRLRGLFRAVHGPTRQHVLLRFLGGPAAGDSQRVNAAAANARTWSEIENAHLSACIELLDLGLYKLVVVEDLVGRSAAEQLRSNGRMSPAQACAAVQSVAMGLVELHGRGLIHGDVRPENIWCDDDSARGPHESGTVRLLGFPLARDPMAPPAGLDEWTADYAAPELAEGAAPTPLTDVYALGCTLYELLTGQPPFASGPLRQSLADKMNRHATEPIVPIDQSGVMPEGLNRVVSFMMAKNPAVRFQDAATVIGALMPYVSGPIAPRDAQNSVAPLKLFCRQRSLSNGGGASGHVATGNGQGPVGGAGATASPLPMAAGPLPTASPNQALFVASAIPSISPVRVSPDGAGATTQPISATPTFAVNTRQPVSTNPASPMIAPVVVAQQQPQARRAPNVKLVATILGVFVLIVVLLVALQWRRGPRDAPQDPVTAADGNDAKTLPIDQPTSSTGQQPIVVPDDGRAIWASPTSGSAPQIRYIAPESQILAVLRPQALLSSPRGRETIDAMGPAGAQLLKWMEVQTGLKPETIERLDIAMYEAFGPQPLVSLVAYVKDRPGEASLIAAWGNPTPVEQGGQRFFQQGELCRYLPPDRKDVVVVAQRPQLDQILAAGNTPATLNLSLQGLVDTGDANRHVSIFFLPIYVRAARDTLYPGAMAPLREALDWFLGTTDDVQAGVVSFELSEPLFAELRLYPVRSKKPIAVAQEFHARVDAWSKQIQMHLISLKVSSYSRDTLAQLPFMLQAVAQYTRHDADGRIAVLRSCLPGEAAANLAIAADLLLLETAGTAGGGERPPTSTAKTVWDRLKQPVTISFERDSLENALKQLSTDMGVKIEILGNDLKLDGITKNQPLGLDMKNKPAEEVLGQIMLQANPDRTVKKLSDDVQKLVYVVKPAAGGGEDVILVTTRAKAAERGELPAIFKK